MKQYEITVDGQVYQVSLKEISEQEAAHAVNAPTAKPAGATAGKEVPAPMAGNILTVNVKQGDQVAAGDTLLVLEAMKMENEIVSPIDGVISEVMVEANQTVESGQLLILI